MAFTNSNRTFCQIQKETAWGDGGSGTVYFLPILDGDYTIALDDPLREQQHIVGDQDAQYMVQDVRNLAGDIKMGMWPHLWKTLLDLCTVRTAGEVDSFTAKYNLTGFEALVHKGLRVNQLTLEGSNGGDVMMTMGCIGSHEETASTLTYPGSYTIPEIFSLLYKNLRFVISLDAGTTFANRINPVGLENFAITISNNLKVGPALEDRINAYKDGRIEFLTTGRFKVDLRYTAAFDRAAYSKLQRDRLRTQFKAVGAHPHATQYLTVSTGGAAAGTSVAVPTDEDPALKGFAVNDIVFFDNAGGANKPSVAKVTALDSVTPFGITVDVLDEAAAAGDHIFNSALELKTAPAICSATQIDKPFDDFVKVSVTAQIFSGGPAPLTYKAQDETL